MADLGTLTGATPLNASNNTYFTFNTNATQSTTSALSDTPADLASMDTLAWQVECSLSNSPGNDTVTLGIRIVNGATILAAADAGGTFASVGTITSQTDSTFGSPTSFAYVNTGASKATWDGASIELQQTISKAGGWDSQAIRVDYVAITGTYTATLPQSYDRVAAIASTSTLTVARGVTRHRQAAITDASTLTVAAPTVTSFLALRPDGDTSLGTWTDEADGTTNIYTSIDEVTPSDTDYVKSAAAPSADTYKVSLSNPSGPPNTSGVHKVSYRYKKESATGQVNLTVKLIQGTSTLIATWSHTDISDTIAQAEQTLTSPQIATITDYTDLHLQFEATEV